MLARFRTVNVLLVALAVTLAGCATATIRRDGPILSETRVVLRGHTFDVHLALRPGPRRSPLLLYATGDGGWWGGDKDVFTHLARWGYPVAGFSARAYVHQLKHHLALGPADVSRDFAEILRAAEAALGLPASTPIILIGKSRGAGLDVAVAGGGPAVFPLAGLVAIGLTAEEEFVHRADDPATMLETYGTLPTLGALPIAVVQSNGDQYVPADRARQLFGPDSATRTLRPVSSTDHNFNGARDLMYDQVKECLEWIVNR